MCRMLHETNHRGLLCVCIVPTLKLMPELLLYNSLPKSEVRGHNPSHKVEVIVDKVANTSMDGYGYLGGLLTGFCFSAYIIVHLRGTEARARGSWEQKCKLVGFGLFAF
jgi:hypothetical protein